MFSIFQLTYLKIYFFNVNNINEYLNAKVQGNNLWFSPVARQLQVVKHTDHCSMLLRVKLLQQPFS